MLYYDNFSKLNLSKEYPLKTLLILLTFSLTYTIANENQMNRETTLSKKHMEKELKILLKNITNYKRMKNAQIKDLKKQTKFLKNKFNNYSKNKNDEIKKLKNELYLSKKKHIQNKKSKNSCNPQRTEIKKLKKELLRTRRELSQKVKALASLKQSQEVERYITKSTPIETIKPTPWIEITVEKDVNIYDLALKYYGDSQEYEKIYTANRHKINSNFHIYDGMSLKIPITESFNEQPMILNTH